jgi:hypothetical protein
MVSKSLKGKTATAEPKPAKAVLSAANAAPSSTEPKKDKKPKMVRDSFTIPKAEYVVIDELKTRIAKLGTSAKKSEVLRAGIKLLAGLSDSALQAAMANVPAIKTGRPSKDVAAAKPLPKATTAPKATPTGVVKSSAKALAPAKATPPKLAPAKTVAQKPVRKAPAAAAKPASKPPVKGQAVITPAPATAP